MPNTCCTITLHMLTITMATKRLKKGRRRERGQSRAEELIRMLLITVWSTVSYDNSNPMHVIATINCRICRVPCATYATSTPHTQRRNYVNVSNATGIIRRLLLHVIENVWNLSSPSSPSAYILMVCRYHLFTSSSLHRNFILCNSSVSVSDFFLHSEIGNTDLFVIQFDRHFLSSEKNERKIERKKEIFRRKKVESFNVD